MNDFDFGPGRAAIRVYHALAALGNDGWCDATQQEIIEQTGISKRHLKRTIQILRNLGWIKVVKRHHPRRKKTMNLYQLLHGIPMSLSYPQAWGQKMAPRPEAWGQKMAPRPTTYSKGNSNLPYRSGGVGPFSDHDHDHDLNENSKKPAPNEILAILDWINEPKRSRLARLPHVTPDYARQFRDIFERDGCPARVNDSVSWLIKIIENGDPPPAIQLELPDEAENFISRGQSREEIEARHPLGQAGMKLGNDGIWR